MYNLKKVVTAFSLIAVIFFVGLDAKSDECPYDLDVINVTVGNCTYEVQICYQCQPQSYHNFFIWAVGVTNCVQNPPLTYEEILNAIYNQIKNNPNYLASLCSVSIPPCGTGEAYLVISTWICWQKVLMDGIL